MVSARPSLDPVVADASVTNRRPWIPLRAFVAEVSVDVIVAE